MNNKEKQTNNRRKKKAPILISIIIFIAILAALIIVLLTTDASKRKQNEPETNQVEIETTESVPVVEENRFNFVMFGIDDVGYTKRDINRSDMIMVVSLDPEAKKIHLISILRDSKVPIDGLEPQKINAAYQEGGAALALKTINDAFHTNFDKYLTLDWQDVVFLVDDIGGIEVDITEEEAEVLNGMVHGSDISREGRNAYSEDVWGGLEHLDGTQAMHFSRIRRIDSDYYRALRQQRTLRGIQQKVQSMSIDEYPWLAKELMQNVVETNLTVDDVMKWMTKGVVNYEITSTIIPDDAYESWVVGDIDEDTGWWVWFYDLDEAAERIHKILGE